MKEVNWKFNIGDEIKDDKRNIVIIDRITINKGDIQPNKSLSKFNSKWYKYKCLKCGNENWMIEGNLSHGFGCNACCSSPQKVVLGINTIWDKARWMCDLGVSEEDAKKYTFRSSKKIEVICPHCGNKKKCRIDSIHKNHSIGCICSDKQSYPEKLMYSILKQLNIEFETQYSPKWIEGKRYDFYIPKLNTIIETHGLQHYEYTGLKRSLEEEKENDKIKNEIALNNGINNYIIIDCRKSELDWIKNNIFNSKLNSLLDLNNIDWNVCEYFACNSNLIKEACNYKSENPNMTTTQIGNIMGYDLKTIRRWLKRGNSLGWCVYDAQKEKGRRLINK